MLTLSLIPTLKYPQSQYQHRVFKTKTLRNTAETLDRFKTPPNQAACLLNAFQADFGVVGTNNGERLVDLEWEG